jgi:DNA-directed RNA polymerase alpha subunit
MVDRVPNPLRAAISSMESGVRRSNRAACSNCFVRRNRCSDPPRICEASQLTYSGVRSSDRAKLVPLSTRARGYLARLGIRTVADLQDWNERSLRGFRGGGRKTVQEIIDAAARAGIPVAPPAREYPWQLNPARWPRR